ncbi:unnamed protein product [Lymnaea stagnalis]|uniref:EGF-like domain-containing protein n=1 Tax=Lymnaea stagnalis TaxID=6523 RepID=A0AAV2IC00_LYMST
MGRQLALVHISDQCTLLSSVYYNVLITLSLLILFTTQASIGYLQSIQDFGEDDSMDILRPYLTHHGPVHRTHRETRSCQSVKYGNVTHSKFAANINVPLTLPLIEANHMLKEVGEYSWQKRQTYIHHQIVNNPLSTFSVLEPGHPGTCQNGTGERFTVVASAQRKQCLVAANAGFFNTATGQCLGNIVSDGVLLQDSGGVQNVHFGLTRDGFIYTGYLSELDLLYQDFTQLVGGVIWLLRDGASYVDESIKIECPDTEETGTLERFVSVVSARTAVGHDSNGRIHMVQVDGKTDQYGVNLHEFAALLLDLGLVNAINLDGGGSATTVVNGTLVNYPSDHCVNSTYNCERKVSTILCVHEPKCSAEDCSGHGSCDMGICQCRGHWAGTACDILSCPNQCSGHGSCTEGGCRCEPGWDGGECSQACQTGWYGVNCSVPCVCENGGSCQPADGMCQCLPGYTGKYCQNECPFGYYGQGCSKLCFCDQSCSCDHVTGSCNASIPKGDYYKVAHCIAKLEIKRLHLVPDTEQQYNLCIISVICVTVLATASLLLNVFLTYLLVRSRQTHKIQLRRRAKLAVKKALQRTAKYANTDNDDEDEDDFQLKISNFKMEKEVEEVVDEEDEGAKTGSGEEEEDLFLAPKKKSGR